MRAVPNGMGFRELLLPVIQSINHNVDYLQSFLDKSCAGDEALRSSVESLLQAVEDSGNFMVIESLPDQTD